jgi:prepilin-type N-terminal cleavage/methylation domain-containing protein
MDSAFNPVRITKPNKARNDMYKSRQRGFTLVEIAIVLVIIGLLLGGILKGQQLISSARVRNMADQNSGIQAAYFGFIDRFRQIPGDMPAALAATAISSTVAVGGTQNGRIDTWAEAGAVWAHLSAAGFINGTYGGATTTVTDYQNGVLTGQVPGNAFQQPIFLGFTDDYDGGGSTSTVRLAYGYGAGVTASLLRELDVKLDDGAPGTGVVRSTSAVGTPKTGEPGGSVDFGTGGTAGQEVLLWNDSGTYGPDCVNTPESNTATYNVDSDNTRCNAVYLY